MSAFKKEPVNLFEMQAELIPFFMGHHLYLKERLTDKLGLFRLGYFTDIFSIMNEMSCYFKENS